MVSGFEFLDTLCTCCLLRPVRVQDRLAEPLEDGRRDNQFSQYICEFAGEGLLARVRLWAFAAVARAMVVDVLPLLQFTNEQATAMTAMHQAGIREIVLDLAGAIDG